MTESEKSKAQKEEDILTSDASGPYVFISHDHRDAELAEAFSKLLKSVSSGMIKTFRSSDKKGKEGIDFGDEWYKRLMTKLQSTTDIVCLFTENSLDRPWILFEAGVAKGKMNTPVIGMALGVSLSRINTGPFYQFQNMDGSEDALIKLVEQLAARITGLELDSDVVKSQVAAFKKTEGEILKKEGKKTKESTDDNPMAKLGEEMKALPSRVAERLLEFREPSRRRRLRHFHPMMLDEMMHTGDPVGILIAASFVRDDVPWLYEIALEIYRAVKYGDMEFLQREMKHLQNISEFSMRGPLFEDFTGGDKDVYIFCKEFPRMLEHMLHRILNEKKVPPKLRATVKRPEQLNEREL